MICWLRLSICFLSNAPAKWLKCRTALSAGDYDQLARVAHTIKGSLGSLHAAQARTHAQELEFAAKQGEGSACRVFFCGSRIRFGRFGTAPAIFTSVVKSAISLCYTESSPSTKTRV